MAAAHELPAQLGVVVEFAVEHDADLAVLVPHRLVTGGQIDDREPAMTEEHTPDLVDMKAVAIGSAMRQRSRHALQIGAAAAARESGQAAHPLRSLCRS